MNNDTASPSGNDHTDTGLAADLIRDKVARIYAQEPAAASELAESETVSRRSKHQQFMYQLSQSGKDLAAIQTEWHEYYQHLPDEEKHQVWQEFYASQSQATKLPLARDTTTEAQTLAQHKHEAARPEHAQSGRKRQRALSGKELQAALRDKITAKGKLQAKHHLQSLLFGLGMGTVVVIIFLFGFFNEIIIAPFIQPSRVAAATPLIISSGNVASTSTPEVIIPKINVEIPVNYSETSTNESVIENDLEDGVVHYPTTVMPGQVGNAAFFGHSSNNIFNKGRYKFAFVLLHTLVVNDTFYLTYNDKVYAYKVISRTIVNPDDVGVLGPVAGQTATATLITCDPPGTSLHRLVVVGQQISPDPSTNGEATAATTSNNTPSSLPNDGPTLWSRFWNTAAGKLSVITAVIVAFLLLGRWINQPQRQKRQQLKHHGLS